MSSSQSFMGGPPESRVRILLVDDQPSNLIALESLLADMNVICVKANSGDEALMRLLEEDFAVLLLDVQMAGLDGFETARLIRDRDKSKHTPIIFITAFDTDRPIVEGAYRLGAVDFLVKPVLPVILRAKVAGFVDLFRKTAQVKQQADELRQLEQQGFSQRLAAENARLLEQREWLRVTLGSIGDAVIATDPAGRVVFLNPIAESLTGWPQREAEGLLLANVFRIFHEETKEPIEDPVSQVIREGVIVGLGDQTVLIAKDGKATEIDDSAAPIRDAAGRILGIVLIFRDVTEKKKAERALREADRRKDEFLAMLAHELRNPLAPLATALEILRIRAQDAETVEQVREMICRQVSHLTHLVDDLLDVSRIVRGKVALKTERLDLARLVRLVARDHQGDFDAAGLTLELDTPEPPIWVIGDATRLTQTLENLLGNAVKFTPVGGKVSIRLSVNDEARQAILIVRDTGVGIEPEILPRLFETFAQADRSLDRSSGGLGLGLALVKGLVELHGGKVEAKSEGPGRGAEFAVWLPKEEELPALAREPLPSIPPATKRLHVLVVEDNRDAADSLQMLLQLVGYEVTVAYTGNEGLEVATRTRPDIVLCDIGLPGMDGFALAGALRHHPHTAAAKLIAVTGYGQDADKRRALAAGFDDHIVKPADPTTLLAKLAAGV